MDKFEALIGDVVLATLVAVVQGETDYSTLDMNSSKIADAKQKMLSAYTAIEAENKKLKAWVREAVFRDGWCTMDMINDAKKLLEGADGG